MFGYLINGFVLPQEDGAVPLPETILVGVNKKNGELSFSLCVQAKTAPDARRLAIEHFLKNHYWVKEIIGFHVSKKAVNGKWCFVNNKGESQLTPDVRQKGIN